MIIIQITFSPPSLSCILTCLLQDVPTKITIGKPLSGNPGTTVLQKPLPGPLSLPRGPVTTAPTSTPSPTQAQQTPVTSQGGSVIVVDISPDRANINTSNALADILQGTGEREVLLTHVNYAGLDILWCTVFFLLVFKHFSLSYIRL